MYDTFHTFAFYTNDLAQNSANVALGTVSDALLNVNSGGYLMPDNWRLMAAYAGIPDPVSAYISSPSLRRNFLPFLDPISPTALPANNPPVIIIDPNGYDLLKTEIVQFVVSRAGAGVADTYGILWAGPRKRPAPPGPIYSMLCTSTTTIAEGVWTQGQITLNQTLPPGDYAIVGASAYGTNLLAARFILKNTPYRPGILAQGAVGEFDLPNFRNGKFGYFGQFNNYDPPLMEFFGVGAGAAQTIVMDLVRL